MLFRAPRDAIFRAVQVPSVPTTESVASRIRELLNEVLDQNQSEMARRCGLDRMDVYRYLRGENMPGAQHLAQIAIAFSVSVDWILCLTDVRRRMPSEPVHLVDQQVVDEFLSGQGRATRSSKRYYAWPGEPVVNWRLVTAAELASIEARIDEAIAAKKRRPGPLPDGKT